MDKGIGIGITGSELGKGGEAGSEGSEGWRTPGLRGKARPQ